MATQRIIINFVLFQLAWVAFVLSAAYQLPWLGFMLGVSLVSIQLAFMPNPIKELQLVIVVCMIGAVFDQLLLNHGVVQYQAHGWSVGLVPVWIVGLWIAFASTLNVSMRWLRQSRLMAIALGAVGGPLAYMAAQKLGAVTLTITPSSHIVLAVGWAALMPLLVHLSTKFDGYAHV